MKRYTKHFAKTFMNTHLVLLLVCVIGVLIGSLYCTSMEKDISFFLNLNQMIGGGQIVKGDNSKIFKMALMIHLIQLFGIWGAGFTKITRSIGIGILFLMSFNYGFSIAALLLLYGSTGIGMSLLLFGVQGVGLLFFGILINEHSIQYGQRGKEVYGKVYRKVSVYCGIGAVLMSVVDAYFQPLVRLFIKV